VLHRLIWVDAVRLQHCVNKAYSKQEQSKYECFGTNIKDSTKLRVALMARIELNYILQSGADMLSLYFVSTKYRQFCTIRHQPPST